MALGSCYTCIKYMMFAFNFIFWLLGCAILGVGIWLRVDENAAEFMKESSKMEIFHTLAYVLIAIGFVIMVIGFLGCCGAIRESQCMLATFFLFLFIIFATLLGFGIWAAVAKESFKEKTETWLKEAVEDYGKSEQQKAFMDSVQTYFKCCGYSKGDQDYIAVGKIPQSCDPDNYKEFDCCGYKNGITDYGIAAVTESSTCKSTNAMKPCSSAFYGWMESKLIIIAGVAIGIAVVLILGMVFSMVLCCAIRDTVA